MINHHLNNLTKLYYSIGEVAKLLGVNPSLLRFWEKEFNLTVAKKNNKGNRLYAVKEIKEISIIYELVKHQGYTIEGAKRALKARWSTQVITQKKEFNVIDKLEEIKQKLENLKI